MIPSLLLLVCLRVKARFERLLKSGVLAFYSHRLRRFCQIVGGYWAACVADVEGRLVPVGMIQDGVVTGAL